MAVTGWGAETTDSSEDIELQSVLSMLSVLQCSSLGSVRFVIDEAGQILASHDYSPFGLPRTGMSNAFGYAGEQWDNSAGLLFLRARYYDPGVGRFISRDPFPGFISLPATLHPYTYAFNNPVLRTDPSGRIVPLVVIFVAGGAILGGAIGGYAYAQTHRNVCGVQWNWDALLWIGGGALLGGAMGYGAWWLGGYVGLWSLGPVAAGGGVVTQQTIQQASVWNLPPLQRGIAVENILGRSPSLARNFPVIDRFINGVVTSIKSINLEASSYQNINVLTRTVKGYIDTMAAYQGQPNPWGGRVIYASEIASRAVDLAIPAWTATQAQLAALQVLQQYAASVGVTLNIIPIP